MNPYKSKIGETNQCRFCGAGLGSQVHAEHYAQCTNAPTLPPVQCPECDRRLSECDGHRCGRCGRPDSEHGNRASDGPIYCGWTLAMVQEHRVMYGGS